MINNLKLWQKLGLMVAFLLLPTAYIAYQHFSTVWESDIAFARKQLEGLEYLEALQPFLRSIPKHRGLKVLDLQGNKKVGKELEDLKKQIKSQIRVVDEVDGKLGQSLNMTQLWGEWKNKCENVLFETPREKITAEKSFEIHTNLMRDLLAMIKYLGGNSKLILDPHLETYYLIKILIDQGPILQEAMAQLRGVGSLYLERKKLEKEEIQKLSEKLHIIQFAWDNTVSELQLGIIKNPQLQVEMQEVETNSRDSIQSVEKILDRLKKEKKMSFDSHQFFEEITRDMRAVHKLYNKVEIRVKKLIQKEEEKGRREVYLSTGVVILGGLVVLYLSWVIIMSIAPPLSRLVDCSKKLAQGQLDISFFQEGRKDEIGELQESFSQMVKSLKKTTRELKEGAAVLAASASEISTSVSQVSSSASETATAVGQTASTAEEVKQTSQVASKKSRQVVEISEKVMKESEKGETAVQQTLEEMKSIEEKMETIARSIVRLSEKSQDIGEIVTTVSDLTEQSNILSVNASIEASKAGEQGEGFKVVAREVKNLADQSKEATGEIRRILKEIQKATSSAVMIAEEGTKAVEKGVHQAQEAGDSIKSLDQAIKEAAQAARQIEASARQQQIGVDQVGEAMGSIREASSQNVDSMKQLEQSAQDIQELGQTLKEVTLRYKL